MDRVLYQFWSYVHLILFGKTLARFNRGSGVCATGFLGGGGFAFCTICGTYGCTAVLVPSTGANGFLYSVL